MICVVIEAPLVECVLCTAVLSVFFFVKVDFQVQFLRFKIYDCARFVRIVLVAFIILRSFNPTNSWALIQTVQWYHVIFNYNNSSFSFN